MPAPPAPCCRSTWRWLPGTCDGDGKVHQISVAAPPMRAAVKGHEEGDGDGKEDEEEEEEGGGLVVGLRIRVDLGLVFY